MLPTQRFLIVEFPGAGMTLAGFTADNPGTTVDLISEPVVQEGSDRLHPSLVLVKGAPPAALGSLLKTLEHVYDQVTTVERDDLRRTWLGRMRIRESALTNTGAAVVLQFQHRYGVAWTHVEDGLVHMRARVTDTAHGDLLADQVNRYLERAGVEAQAEVREISPKDYGVWEDLVQRAIGLAP